MKSEVDNFERSGCQALNWVGAAAPPYLGMETRLGGSLDLPEEQIRKPQSAIRNLPRRSEAKTDPHPARKTKAQKTQREKALLPLRSLRSLRLNPNPAIRNPQSSQGSTESRPTVFGLAATGRSRLLRCWWW